MSFVDKVRIFAKSGRGGDGCLAFLREKYRAFGGPNGGDGGKGGDVVLIADANVGTLLDLTFKPHLSAAPGGNGKGSSKTGASARDTLVRVPVGTVVFRDGRLLADLSRPGDRVVAAQGGRGGRGNESFKNRRNTAPRLKEKGEPGEEAVLDLELKLIADVGLVGFPNAGKSTLLSRLSNARPKVADYPFTTLAPHLGLVAHKERSFVLADLPGLIEGAHSGKGLGHEFLRHVERTRVLVHMIDPLGFKGTSPADGIRKIEGELKEYSRVLAKKPRVLAINKADLPESAEVVRKIRARYRKRKLFVVSAVSGEGVSELVDAVLAELERNPRELMTFIPEDGREIRVERGFAVRRLAPGVFQVRGRFVERAAAMSDMSLVESVYRLQSTLKRIGVEKELKAAGVRDGDMVRIGSLELEWSDSPIKAPPRLPRRKRVK